MQGRVRAVDLGLVGGTGGASLVVEQDDELRGAHPSPYGAGRSTAERCPTRRPRNVRRCHDGPVTTPTQAPADGALPVGEGRRETADAIVIGGGPNGLVAAITLADAGWDVVLLEARDKVGGAVSSVDVDGWVMDEFSACHPLAAASPVVSRFGLEDHGLEWCRSEVVVTHAGQPDDDLGASIYADVNTTAAALAEDRREDGTAWLRLVEQWHHVKEPFLDALLTRWPPVEAGSRLARAVGAADMPALARFFLLPAGRMAEECFAGQRGRMLLLGNAMHADIPPEAPGSGLFGWLMSMLASPICLRPGSLRRRRRGASAARAGS